MVFYTVILSIDKETTMWKLISLKEQSKIEMIEAFYSTNDPITIDTLSKLTNSSSRSIKNYLKELQVFMEPLGAEFESSSEGVNFNIPIHIGLDFFQKHLFKDSLGFNLLEKVFFDETLNSSDLAKALFVSPSTLNRLTKTITEALRPFGLTLETSPYKVVGHEQLVRHFYVTYFLEAYNVNEWPFEGIDEELVDEVLPSSMDYYEYTSDVMNYTEFKYRFAVALIRYLKGYIYQSKLAYRDKIVPFYDKKLLEVQEYLNHVDFKSLEDKEGYTRVLAFTHLSISSDYLQVRLKSSKEYRKQFKEISYMIDFLTKYFELPVVDQTHLILEIDRILSLLANNDEGIQPRSYIFYPPRDYFLVGIYRRKYTAFYDTLKSYILLLCRNRGFVPEKETLNYLIYKVISKWKDLTKNLFNRYNSIVIKVYSHQNLRHAYNAAQSLQSDLPNTVTVSVLDEVSLNEEILSKYDFDLLITTQTLFFDIDQPIVFMHLSRNSYQYRYLLELISKIALKKENKAREKFIMNITSHNLEEHLASLVE